MRKRFLCLGIVILLCLLSIVNAYAGTSTFHNSKTKRLLFSSGRCLSSKKDQAEKNIEMIQSAMYLAIDQSGEKKGDSDKLAFLNANGVKGIANDLLVINPKSPFMHRSYTHRGWDWNYIDDEANWPERKKILVNTIDTIFDFKKYSSSSSEAEKRKDAFCKLLYYSHVLGDLYYDDCDTLDVIVKYDDSETDQVVEKDRGLIIAFAYAHPGQTNKDALWEIQDAIETLFSNQRDSQKYLSLKQKLSSLAKEARSLAGTAGGVNTREKIQQRCDYESRLIVLLESYIPLLLDDESFFRAAFPI